MKNTCLGALLLTLSIFSSCQKDAATQTTPTNIPVSSVNLKSLASTATSKYKVSAPIVLNGVNNITISGDSINVNGGSTIGITIINCKNIHITKSKILNSTNRGIWVWGSTNVLIDSCYISNVSVGIYAHASQQVRVYSNQLLNMKGPAGSFIQFDNITGGYNRICYNNCEDVIGSGTNPNPNAGDGISLYQSNGASTDPIYVIGNSIRGGCTQTGSKGMAGIVAGDLGGSYQVITNNTLVNTGYVGIQMQGGSHISIVTNSIYSDRLPWSEVGLVSANYSGLPSSSNTITGNKVNWNSGYVSCGCNFHRDTAYKANNNPMPTGWKSNTVNAAITSSILPAALIKQ
ncbi:MAG: right-handed parallel beta-helix repeat-containing protein [Mucilaginibacter sp.]